MADNQFFFLGNSSHSQMMGCVMKTPTKTVVIDGGSCGDWEQLTKMLSEQCGGHVDGWFFTHPHHDHIGAYCEMAKKAPHIKVDKLYQCFPKMEELEMRESRRPDEKALWAFMESPAQADKTHRLAPGECFTFDGVSIRVLRVFDPAITVNFINNSSAVFHVSSAEKSFLILGDLGKEGERRLIDECPLTLLQTDYTQMAHHGQKGVSRAFYEYIQPKACLWAAPLWLWNNDMGDGFDSGPFDTVRTREWMQALGVTVHYISKDGTHIIDF